MANACKDLRPLLQAALDGELVAADRRNLGAHLARCPSCAEELAAGQLAIASLAALPAPEPGPGFVRAVARGIAAAQTRRARVQRSLSWAAAAGTCLIAAMFVAAWFALSGSIWSTATSWAWGAARVVVPLVDVLGDAAATLGRGLMPLGGAAAKLSWLGFGWLATWYALALGALLLVVIATRAGRRLARVPIFSL